MFGSSKQADGATTNTTNSSSSTKESSTASTSTDAIETGDTGNSSGTSPPIQGGSGSGEKRSNNVSPDTGTAADQKKRRGSGVGSKASNIFASAKSSLGFDKVGKSSSDGTSAQTPLQKLGKQDPSLAVPQGQHNNAAGESLPSPNSTFRVGVWEDRNKKCRRTMEDTHAFLYNFLHTPAPVLSTSTSSTKDNAVKSNESITTPDQNMIETDNGYFAIFDGHAGTFAADWCGKKLHLILEDIIRKNPNTPIPEILDQTFTTVDAQLDKLPLKNSGCTAAVAVMRWEDRVPSNASQTGSQGFAAAAAAAASKPSEASDIKSEAATDKPLTDPATTLKSNASRQRVLYTANVGDARIVLCRAGKALRLSYDHKGSDENEGKRISAAGGLILNNRVNGVLAVTRALGDTYMKELVTGHPYTTETVIQPDVDEFMIIACDGLWDVCDDQDAVDLIRNVHDPASASKMLVGHALGAYSTDNLSCMTVRFHQDALLEVQNNKESRMGVEGDPSIEAAGKAAISEAEKIVSATKQKIAEGGTPAVGVSASNSGKGHDLKPIEVTGGASDGANFVPSKVDGDIKEEPAQLDEDSQPNSEGRLGVDDLKPPPKPRNST